jgi:hypothetical protein
LIKANKIYHPGHILLKKIEIEPLKNRLFTILNFLDGKDKKRFFGYQDVTLVIQILLVFNKLSNPLSSQIVEYPI